MSRQFHRPSQDQRQTDRYGVAYPIKVYDTNHQQMLGQLVNLSLDGLMIAGVTPLQDDHVYQLELWLPSPLLGSDRLQLGVDCLWNRADAEESLCWAGCQIIDLSDLARQQILALIALLSDNSTNI